MKCHPIAKTLAKVVITEHVIIDGSLAQFFKLSNWAEIIYENCDKGSRCGKCLLPGSKQCCLPRDKAMRHARELKKYYK